MDEKTELDEKTTLDVPMAEFEVKPIANLIATGTGYRIEIWPYLFGQYRVMLIKGENRFGLGPNVVRQMCTYAPEIAVKVCAKLVKSPNPEKFCRRLERPWNCEYPGGRIRLDNKPGEHRPVNVSYDMGS